MRSLVKKIKPLFPKSLRGQLPDQVKIVLISPKISQRLNKIYLGRSRSANVLSFYYGKKYGEVLICPSVIREEARTRKNPYDYQMTWMVMHGMIHLAGLHHEKSKFYAARVGKLERKILGVLCPVGRGAKS